MQKLLRDAYIDLLKYSLTGALFEDNSIHGDFGELYPESYDRSRRRVGLGWPVLALSMIGDVRMDNLQFCLEQIVKDNIDGDVIETGVWRGGATIFMRGFLKAYGITNKIVWVADSFKGLPSVNIKLYPQDYPLNWMSKHSKLSISLKQVRNNFSKYDLLDKKVRFLRGWFKDTLPKAPIKKLALMRLDGDMYESTMTALTYLYPKLVSGGYCIIDDFSVPACQQAVHEYRQKYSITEKMVGIDWTGIYWRKM